MSESQRDASAECDMIFGTYSMASEGLDLPALDTIVFATPKCDVEQAIGRILRSCYGKKTPVVIDLVDPFSHYQNYGWRRRAFYLKHHYAVTRESHVTFLPRFRQWLNSVDHDLSSDQMDDNIDDNIDDQMDANDATDGTEPEPWL